VGAFLFTVIRVYDDRRRSTREVLHASSMRRHALKKGEEKKRVRLSEG